MIDNWTRTAVFTLWLSSIQSFQIFPFIKRNTAIFSSDTQKWWTEKEIKFKCTGCGKCCQSDGEVWLDTDEFLDVANLRQESPSIVMEKYVAEHDFNSVRLKDKYVTDSLRRNISECIFLEDGKCSIYEARPTQCRTFPYWPRLLRNESNWLAEAVVPDKIEGKHWDPDEGGCEGINHVEAEKVDIKVIYRNEALYKQYHGFYPFVQSRSPALGSKEGFISYITQMEDVIKATKSWISQFVIHYNLCPFAEKVFLNKSIRYRVSFETNKAKVEDILRFEVLHLLCTPEIELSTTLIMFPLAFPDFQEYNNFCIKFEDEILKRIESEGPKKLKNQITEKSNKTKKLKEIFLERKLQNIEKENILEPNVQIAAFHPLFQWANTDMSEPINYEKKAPFPTINLLRADKVRKYASEGLTSNIAERNEDSLQNAGYKELSEKFENILLQLFRSQSNIIL